MNPFDILNSINFTKKDLTKEDLSLFNKSYNAFIINRSLSYSNDSVFFANEMNLNAHLPADMQYQFLKTTLRQKKRFAKFIKKEKEEYLDHIKKYYNYSNSKAREVLSLLSVDELEFIKSETTLPNKNKK